MLRDEFIEQLTLALQGEINQLQINEHISYYENYIMEEARKGRNEGEVIESLGEPRLIAKTIIETTDKIENSDNMNDSARQRADAAKGWSIFGTGYGKILLIFLVILFLIWMTRFLIFLLPFILLFLLISLIIKFLNRHK